MLKNEAEYYSYLSQGVRLQTPGNPFWVFDTSPPPLSVSDGVDVYGASVTQVSIDINSRAGWPSMIVSPADIGNPVPPSTTFSVGWDTELAEYTTAASGDTWYDILDSLRDSLAGVVATNEWEVEVALGLAWLEIRRTGVDSTKLPATYYEPEAVGLEKDRLAETHWAEFRIWVLPFGTDRWYSISATPVKIYENWMDRIATVGIRRVYVQIVGTPPKVPFYVPPYYVLFWNAVPRL